MAEASDTVALPGCRPGVLAGYLKALAVLRLVSEQADAQARAWWQDGVFQLRSSLSAEGLDKFLLREYRPTPLVAPWNGGSGFYPKDQRAALECLEASTSPRFASYAQVIQLSQQVVESSGLGGKPESGDRAAKADLLTRCRNAFPDDALRWLDATYLLTSSGPKYPPLLGTGGNDGRLEFTNNLMQRLVEVIDPTTGHPRARAATWLRAALYDEPAVDLVVGNSPGQFVPGGVEAPNATSGFTGSKFVNPWDFILILEGALLFSAAATRRLGDPGPGALSFPFTVRSVGVGYGSAATQDAAAGRAETWLPLWSRPTGVEEVSALLAEGRAQVARRVARDGTDFARAVAALGVDRGIESFERFGYLRRSGRAFLAVSLGRWPVQSRPHVDLLCELDRWLDLFRRAARDPDAPARLGRAMRSIDRATMDVCRHGGAPRWQELVSALGEAERTMARSRKTTAAPRWRLRPVPPLSPKWLQAADDGSAEFRLACALASIRGPTPVGPLRANMIPLDLGRRQPAFDREHMDSPAVVWSAGDLSANLYACLARRCLDAARANLEQPPLGGSCPARLDDVARFVLGEVVDEKLEVLLWGLNAIAWDRARPQTTSSGRWRTPLPAAYSLLKLLYLPDGELTTDAGVRVQLPHDAAIARRAYHGQLAAATRLAARRLRASGFPTAVQVVTGPPAFSRRLAAALLFPLSPGDVSALAGCVARPQPAASHVP